LYGTAIPLRKLGVFLFFQLSLQRKKSTTYLNIQTKNNRTMKQNLMRPLTEVEMEETYGGKTWLASAWEWIKKHVLVRTDDDPHSRIEVTTTINF
jgi:hypothetical protein